MATMETCDECGYVYDLAAAEEAAGAIATGSAEISVLLNAGGDLRTRRQSEVWSPLEYGCHVRDVLLMQRERVLAAQWLDDYVCVPMGRDERVELDGYAEQDPLDVARQLTDAALLFGNALQRLRPAAWDRTLIYPYPQPTARSLRWVASHTVHEVRHHGLDIRMQLSPPG